MLCAGGCGEINGIQHILERPPKVFAMQIAWESQNESAEDINATMSVIREVSHPHKMPTRRPFGFRVRVA